MPEFPDVVVVVERLAALLVGHRCSGIRLASPFVLRSVTPPISSVVGKAVVGTQRIGKRVVIELEGELFIVIHLMISGRVQWRALDEKGAVAKIPAKIGLAAFDFDNGSLTFTEASPKKRASLHLVQGIEALKDHDPGGVDVFAIDELEFAAALRHERHTLKRTLTDPRLFAGIGNAYSDEILHRAKVSPVKQTKTLTGEEISRLYDAIRTVLPEWLERLKQETGDEWPEKVTAFRPEMAVHGKHKQPCPVCGSPVQRIVHADNETNYCARCQTGGKLLADRSLSRLLKEDWPGTLEDLEEYVASRGGTQ
ncbi:MAG TPA: DNA-formamidopyrimidine glycosylase family protein [Archangium sp.]